MNTTTTQIAIAQPVIEVPDFKAYSEAFQKAATDCGRAIASLILFLYKTLEILHYAVAIAAFHGNRFTARLAEEYRCYRENPEGEHEGTRAAIARIATVYASLIAFASRLPLGTAKVRVAAIAILIVVALVLQYSFGFTQASPETLNLALEAATT